MQIVSESYDGIPNGVLCTTKDLTAMARVWPCSGLRSGTMIIFEFDNHGNLCDIEWLDDDGVTCSEPAGIDQYCLHALSQDAQQFLAQSGGAR